MLNIHEYDINIKNGNNWIITFHHRITSVCFNLLRNGKISCLKFKNGEYLYGFCVREKGTWKSSLGEEYFTQREEAELELIESFIEIFKGLIDGELKNMDLLSLGTMYNHPRNYYKLYEGKEGYFKIKDLQKINKKYDFYTVEADNFNIVVEEGRKGVKFNLLSKDKDFSKECFYYGRVKQEGAYKDMISVIEDYLYHVLRKKKITKEKLQEIINEYLKED